MPRTGPARRVPDDARFPPRRVTGTAGRDAGTRHVLCGLAALLVAAHADAAVVVPPPLGFDGEELVNVDRGQYRWYDRMLAPLGTTTSTSAPAALVTYDRFGWRDVEPSPGVYDFSKIDAAIARAAARGSRYAFRVMPISQTPFATGQTAAPIPRTGAATVIDLQGVDLASGSWPLRLRDFSQMPAWAIGRMNTWYYEDAAGATVVPDWNNSEYLARWKALIAALGARYDTDDRVAFVDLNGYGNWGEWHAFPFDRTRAPRGQLPITDANAVALADANLAAFRATRIVSLTGQHAAFARMLTRATTGVRFDCLGDTTGGWALVNLREVAGGAERWRTAPVVTEWCQYKVTEAPPELGLDAISDGTRDLYRVARKQVMNAHVSLLSGGNFPAQYGAPMTAAQMLDYSMAIKTSGYRMRVSAVDVPTTVTAGGAITLRTTWTNLGVAPVYEPWKVMLELRRTGSTETVVQGRSVADLRTIVAPSQTSTGEGQILPTPASSTVTDTFTLWSGIAPGNYDVVLRVLPGPAKTGATTWMPASFYARPMALAQGNRLPDGSYRLATITVQAP